jgi:hypothetical protein
MNDQFRECQSEDCEYDLDIVIPIMQARITELERQVKQLAIIIQTTHELPGKLQQ